MIKYKKLTNLPDNDIGNKNVHEINFKKNQIRDQEIHSGKSEETSIKI